MPFWTFRLSAMDVALFAAITTGLVFACLLLFAPRTHRAANRLLGLAVLVMVLWLCWVLGIDVWIQRYFPYWSWFPWQWSLALGPLVYFYVRKLLFVHTRFNLKSAIHFLPLLFEQYALISTIADSRRTGIPPFDTETFSFFSPLLALLALISVLVYLLLSLQQLRSYRKLIAGALSDTERYQYRWLQRLLLIMMGLWFLWLPFSAADYFWFQYRLPLSAYHPLHFAMTVIVIWIGAEAFLRPEIILVEIPPPAAVPADTSQVPSGELLEQAARVRREVELNLFYLDPELSLRSLAEELDLYPQELSYIINAGTGQNFNDFINTYRVEEVKRKMQDPAFGHITLLGIAFASGFNSKTTFNRTFKNQTGSSPAMYKKRGAI